MAAAAYTTPETAIRTERSFGVTSSLKPNQRQHLLALINSEVWEDLLDVMEMQCIEIETQLINTPPEDEAKILASHKYAKAAWVIFTRFQQKVMQEAQIFFNSQKPQPENTPVQTREEQWTDHLLDPTRPAPEGSDYFGI